MLNPSAILGNNGGGHQLRRIPSDVFDGSNNSPKNATPAVAAGAVVAEKDDGNSNNGGGYKKDIRVHIPKGVQELLDREKERQRSEIDAHHHAYHSASSSSRNNSGGRRRRQNARQEEEEEEDEEEEEEDGSTNFSAVYASSYNSSSATSSPTFHSSPSSPLPATPPPHHAARVGRTVEAEERGWSKISFGNGNGVVLSDNHTKYVPLQHQVLMLSNVEMPPTTIGNGSSNSISERRELSSSPFTTAAGGGGEGNNDVKKSASIFLSDLSRGSSWESTTTTNSESKTDNNNNNNNNRGIDNRAPPSSFMSGSSIASNILNNNNNNNDRLGGFGFGHPPTIEALLEQLSRPESPAITVSVTKTIADMAKSNLEMREKIGQKAGIFHVLCGVLKKSPLMEGRAHAALALAYLSKKSAANRKAIGEISSVFHGLKDLLLQRESSFGRAAAALAVAHICTKCEYNRKAIGKLAGMFEALVALLDKKEDTSCQSRGALAIANLSCNSENSRMIGKLCPKVFESLVRMMSAAITGGSGSDGSFQLGRSDDESSVSWGRERRRMRGGGSLSPSSASEERPFHQQHHHHNVGASDSPDSFYNNTNNNNYNYSHKIGNQNDISEVSRENSVDDGTSSATAPPTAVVPDGEGNYVIRVFENDDNESAVVVEKKNGGSSASGSSEKPNNNNNNNSNAAAADSKPRWSSRRLSAAGADGEEDDNIIFHDASNTNRSVSSGSMSPSLMLRLESGDGGSVPSPRPTSSSTLINMFKGRAAAASGGRSGTSPVDRSKQTDSIVGPAASALSNLSCDLVNSRAIARVPGVLQVLSAVLGWEKHPEASACAARTLANIAWQLDGGAVSSATIARLVILLRGNGVSDKRSLLHHYHQHHHHHLDDDHTTTPSRSPESSETDGARSVKSGSNDNPAAASSSATTFMRRAQTDAALAIANLAMESSAFRKIVGTAKGCVDQLIYLLQPSSGASQETKWNAALAVAHISRDPECAFRFLSVSPSSLQIAPMHITHDLVDVLCQMAVEAPLDNRSDVSLALAELARHCADTRQRLFQNTRVINSLVHFITLPAASSCDVADMQSHAALAIGRIAGFKPARAIFAKRHPLLQALFAMVRQLALMRYGRSGGCVPGSKKKSTRSSAESKATAASPTITASAAGTFGSQRRISNDDNSDDEKDVQQRRRFGEEGDATANENTTTAGGLRRIHTCAPTAMGNAAAAAANMLAVQQQQQQQLQTQQKQVMMQDKSRRRVFGLASDEGRNNQGFGDDDDDDDDDDDAVVAVTPFSVEEVDEEETIDEAEVEDRRQQKHKADDDDGNDDDNDKVGPIGGSSSAKKSAHSSHQRHTRIEAASCAALALGMFALSDSSLQRALNEDESVINGLLALLREKTLSEARAHAALALLCGWLGGEEGGWERDRGDGAEDVLERKNSFPPPASGSGSALKKPTTSLPKWWDRVDRKAFLDGVCTLLSCGGSDETPDVRVIAARCCQRIATHSIDSCIELFETEGAIVRIFDAVSGLDVYQTHRDAEELPDTPVLGSVEWAEVEKAGILVSVAGDASLDKSSINSKTDGDNNKDNSAATTASASASAAKKNASVHNINNFSRSRRRVTSTNLGVYHSVSDQETLVMDRIRVQRDAARTAVAIVFQMGADGVLRQLPSSQAAVDTATAALCSPDRLTSFFGGELWVAFLQNPAIPLRAASDRLILADASVVACAIAENITGNTSGNTPRRRRSSSSGAGDGSSVAKESPRASSSSITPQQQQQQRIFPSPVATPHSASSSASSTSSSSSSTRRPGMASRPPRIQRALMMELVGLFVGPTSRRIATEAIACALAESEPLVTSLLDQIIEDREAGAPSSSDALAEENDTFYCRFLGISIRDQQQQQQQPQQQATVSSRGGVKPEKTSGSGDVVTLASREEGDEADPNRKSKPLHISVPSLFNQNALVPPGLTCTRAAAFALSCIVRESPRAATAVVRFIQSRDKQQEMLIESLATILLRKDSFFHQQAASQMFPALHSPAMSLLSPRTPFTGSMMMMMGGGGGGGGSNMSSNSSLKTALGSLWGSSSNTTSSNSTNLNNNNNNNNGKSPMPSPGGAGWVKPVRPTLGRSSSEWSVFHEHLFGEETGNNNNNSKSFFPMPTHVDGGNEGGNGARSGSESDEDNEEGRGRRNSRSSSISGSNKLHGSSFHGQIDHDNSHMHGLIRHVQHNPSGFHPQMHVHGHHHHIHHGHHHHHHHHHHRRPLSNMAQWQLRYPQRMSMSSEAALVALFLAYIADDLADFLTESPRVLSGFARLLRTAFIACGERSAACVALNRIASCCSTDSLMRLVEFCTHSNIDNDQASNLNSHGSTASSSKGSSSAPSNCTSADAKSAPDNQHSLWSAVGAEMEKDGKGGEVVAPNNNKSSPTAAESPGGTMVVVLPSPDGGGGAKTPLSAKSWASTGSSASSNMAKKEVLEGIVAALRQEENVTQESACSFLSIICEVSPEVAFRVLELGASESLLKLITPIAVSTNFRSVEVKRHATLAIAVIASIAPTAGKSMMTSAPEILERLVDLLADNDARLQATAALAIASLSVHRPAALRFAQLPVCLSRLAILLSFGTCAEATQNAANAVAALAQVEENRNLIAGTQDMYSILASLVQGEEEKDEEGRGSDENKTNNNNMEGGENGGGLKNDPVFLRTQIAAATILARLAEDSRDRCVEMIRTPNMLSALTSAIAPSTSTKLQVAALASLTVACVAAESEMLTSELSSVPLLFRAICSQIMAVNDCFSSNTVHFLLALANMTSCSAACEQAKAIPGLVSRLCSVLVRAAKELGLEINQTSPLSQIQQQQQQLHQQQHRSTSVSPSSISSLSVNSSISGATSSVSSSMVVTVPVSANSNSGDSGNTASSTSSNGTMNSGSSSFNNSSGHSFPLSLRDPEIFEDGPDDRERVVSIRHPATGSTAAAAGPFVRAHPSVTSIIVPPPQGTVSSVESMLLVGGGGGGGGETDNSEKSNKSSGVIVFSGSGAAQLCAIEEEMSLHSPTPSSLPNPIAGNDPLHMNKEDAFGMLNSMRSPKLPQQQQQEEQEREQLTVITASKDDGDHKNNNNNNNNFDDEASPPYILLNLSEATKCAARTLGNLAADDEMVARTIGKYPFFMQSLAQLLIYLPGGNRGDTDSLLLAIASLSCIPEHSEVFGAVPGVLTNICSYLRKPNPVARTHALLALCNLVWNSVSNRHRLIEEVSGAVSSICATLRCGFASAEAIAARLVSRLALLPQAANKLREVAGLQASLLQLLSSGRPDAQAGALAALAYLVSGSYRAVNEFVELPDSLQIVWGLLSSSHVSVQEHAALCVARLAKESFQVKMRFSSQPNLLEVLSDMAAGRAGAEASVHAVEALACLSWRAPSLGARIGVHEGILRSICALLFASSPPNARGVAALAVASLAASSQHFRSAFSGVKGAGNALVLGLLDIDNPEAIGQCTLAIAMLLADESVPLSSLGNTQELLNALTSIARRSAAISGGSGGGSPASIVGGAGGGLNSSNNNVNSINTSSNISLGNINFFSSVGGQNLSPSFLDDSNNSAFTAENNKTTAILAIANLSGRNDLSSAVNTKETKGLFECLSRVLRDGPSAAQSHAARAVANFAARSENVTVMSNVAALFGGVVLTLSNGSAEAQACAALAIANIVSAQPQLAAHVRKSGVEKALGDLIQRECPVMVQEYASLAIANIASSSKKKGDIVDDDDDDIVLVEEEEDDDEVGNTPSEHREHRQLVIERLVDLLQTGSVDARINAASALANLAERSQCERLAIQRLPNIFPALLSLLSGKGMTIAARALHVLSEGEEEGGEGGEHKASSFASSHEREIFRRIFSLLSGNDSSSGAKLGQQMRP